ncbi:MAG: hypothetical protein IT303_15945 [Dehalococcoidia bacterium]|nr:hypothetical protein [Dehalococcoidia bacterium]
MTLHAGRYRISLVDVLRCWVLLTVAVYGAVAFGMLAYWFWEFPHPLGIAALLLFCGGGPALTAAGAWRWDGVGDWAKRDFGLVLMLLGLLLLYPIAALLLPLVVLSLPSLLVLRR